MKNSGRSWAPTITLAKLFEEQNQFFDALAAYELISQNDSSPAVRERIEALQLRILNDPGNRYDPRIEKLFTPEELAYLKILNHQGFENMAQARAKLQEGALAAEIYIDEDEDVLLEEESEADALARMLQEIEQQAQLNVSEPALGIPEYTVKDLLMAVLSRFNKDQKLDEVRLSDLVAIILEMQGGKAGS
ncbi:MAG TPA: hypothetical protein PLG20_01800 [Candidatus Syntrophosphaera sp.]|nr:hypothetical protein [Candidatus Syntrophosphaera sp.]